MLREAALAERQPDEAEIIHTDTGEDASFPIVPVADAPDPYPHLRLPVPVEIFSPLNVRVIARAGEFDIHKIVAQSKNTTEVESQQ